MAVCYSNIKINCSPKDSFFSEAIINEAIDAFDALIEMVNAKKVENKKVHFKSVENSLEATAAKLIEKVNQL